jgi:2-dehydro-3-deoxy-D-gluconate 5-dehydrogenase
MALGLARAGASVAVLSRNPGQNQSVLDELKAIGKPALVVPLDVTDRAALPGALAEVERALGGIDILVNNAGIVALRGGVLNESAHAWDTTIETHLNATFLLSQLVAKSMVKRKSGGKIINLASMYSIFGSGLVPSYSAAKGAIVQLTKSLAIELAPHNIQVNAIAPGWIETDMTAAVRNSPMKRRNPRAHARQALGKSRRNHRSNRFSCLSRSRLHHRNYPAGRWWVFGLLRQLNRARPYNA